MKIEQEKTEFKPITLTLETREEALEFLEIIDKVDNQMTYKSYNDIQIGLSIKISDAFTNMDVII